MQSADYLALTVLLTNMQVYIPIDSPTKTILDMHKGKNETYSHLLERVLFIFDYVMYTIVEGQYTIYLPPIWETTCFEDDPCYKEKRKGSKSPIINMEKEEYIPVDQKTKERLELHRGKNESYKYLLVRVVFVYVCVMEVMETGQNTIQVPSERVSYNFENDPTYNKLVNYCEMND